MAVLWQMRPIRPLDNNGSILLRWTVAGERYALTPVPGGSFTDPVALLKAHAIANRIMLDLAQGAFDPTLAAYKTAPAPPAPRFTRLPPLWDAWVGQLDVTEAARADHYRKVRLMLAAANPALYATGWLTGSTLAGSTYNGRLGTVKRCLDWAVRRDFASHNPYAELQPRRHKQPPIEPFSLADMRAILQAFAQLRPAYEPLTRFLFLSACRWGEAAGLRWQHVNLAENTLTICEALTRVATADGEQLKRKGTKTGESRTLNLSTELRELLEAQPRLKHGRVFSAPKGGV
ncbi:MAG: site-specific integrase, partial [Cyanobacteria bacterium J06626_23]